MIAAIVTEGQFIDAFRDMGRQDNFSYQGLKGLYEYLIDWAEDTGETIELDVIALCCEYSEYETVQECCDEYNLTGSSNAERLDQLQYHTSIVWTSSDTIGGPIIIAQF